MTYWFGNSSHKQTLCPGCVNLSSHCALSLEITIKGLMMRAVLFLWIIARATAANHTLYWTADNPDIGNGQSDIWIIQGDPERWVNDKEAMSVQRFTKLWGEANVLPESIVADFKMPQRPIVHDYISGKIIQFDFGLDLEVQAFYGSSRELVDLALDWVGQNVYYTEGDQIGIWSYRNGHFQVLLRNLGSPQGIDVDPLNGYIFWADSGGSIKRSTLSGNDMSSILEEDATPSVITVDTDKMLVYWVNTDNNKVEMCDYNGGQRSLFSQGSPAASLDIYEDFVLLLQQNELELDVYLANGTVHALSADDSFATGLQHGMFIASQETQPDATSTCDTDNGGCQHICVPEPQTASHSCICQFGYSYDTALSTCTRFIVTERFLLVADIEKLYQVELSTGDTHIVPIDIETSRLDSIVYDSQAQTIYVINKGMIIRKHLVTLNEHIIPIPAGSSAEALVLDTDRHKLYYGDQTRNRIMVISLDDESEEVFTQLGSGATFGLQLDMAKGHIYWTRVIDNVGIQRADLATSLNRITLVSEDIEAPYGLALDLPEQKLYWCDYKKGTIEGVSLDGTGRQLVHDAGTNLVDVAVDSMYIYASNFHRIIRVNKETLQMDVLGSPVFRALYGLEVYAPVPTTPSPPSTNPPAIRTTVSPAQSTPDQPADTSSHVLNLTTIITISVCVGGSVILAIVIAVVVVLVKRSRSHRDQSAQLQPGAIAPKTAQTFDNECFEEHPEDRSSGVYLEIPCTENVPEQYLTNQQVDSCRNDPHNYRNLNEYIVR